MRLEERKEKFKQPTREFQAKPFWSWNGKLEKDELLRQIDIMKEMGFGGFFMHSRTGLETEYLGEDWFSFINQCADYGSSQGMEAWLYDEDRWPSGSAGGLVTKQEKFRAMFLEMTALEREDLEHTEWTEGVQAAFACIKSDAKLCAKRRILKEDFLMADRRDLLKEGEQLLLFTAIYAENSDNYNGYCYADTMNREATEAFLAITHEKYKEKCGKRLGNKIQGIFTDEPHRGPCFTEFSGGRNNRIPFTPKLFMEFEKRFGYDLIELLPEVFLQKEGEELSKVTRDYFELCQQLFIENFAIPTMDWCKKNGLLITGHVLHEDNLAAQATMQGSLMRYYEYMDYPGIDLLGEHNTCYWVAKQVASAARQLDKKWVLSELDGCSGWQMNFQSYKNIGDWQALFGINLRCPHLSWYTMKGEAKRDYPASILHQSPWYKSYHYLEDYYSRIHTALYEGEPECGLLVINPIESVWSRAYCGAFQGLSSEDEALGRLEEQYAHIFHWLAGNRIDFDYGEEDIMSRHGRVENGILYVGKAGYQKVLAAGIDTMRETTVKLLEELIQQGGEVVFAGEVPGFVDVKPSTRIKEMAKKAVVIPMEEKMIADTCRCGYEIVIEGTGSDEIFARSMTIDGGKMVMLLNVNRETAYKELTVDFGEGTALEQWDPRSGDVIESNYCRKDGKIKTELNLEAGGERLYFLPELKESPKKREENPFQREKTFSKAAVLPEELAYRLSEQNVCVLDMVTMTTEDGISFEKQEVLKADRILRDYLSLPWRGGEMLQPWYEVKFGDGNKEKQIGVTLKFTVEVEVLPKGVFLAIEELHHFCEIRVNETALVKESAGKWIDICFDKIKIPDVAWKEGENTIILKMDYYKTSGLEAIYLLGEFGVTLEGGKKAVLGRLPERLKIGDISEQGLPFYSGSVSYEIGGTGDDILKQNTADIGLENHKVWVQANRFGGSLLRLHNTAGEEMLLAFAPYQGEISDLTEIEVVLTRRNTFGPLHELPKQALVYGPDNFVTAKDAWSDAYVLYEQGLLEKPDIRSEALCCGTGKA